MKLRNGRNARAVRRTILSALLIGSAALLSATEARGQHPSHKRTAAPQVISAGSGNWLFVVPVDDVVAVFRREAD